MANSPQGQGRPDAVGHRPRGWSPGWGAENAQAADAVEPEFAGFPPAGQLPQLSWIGPDYVSVLIYDLARGLLRQDPGTQVMGVRCDAEPAVRTSVDQAGYIRGQDAAFALQVFVRDGGGRLWRMRGRWTYVGRDLGTNTPSVTHYWELFDLEGG